MMGIIEEIITSLTPVLSVYGWLITYVASAIWGDATIIALAFIAAQGTFPIWVVVVFGYFGTLTGDCIWFLLTYLKFWDKLKRWKKFSDKFEKVDERIQKLGKKSDLYVLIVTKFLYGTRILTILYVGLKKLPFRKFLLYDGIATIFWIIAMSGIGYATGKGFQIVIQVFKNVQLGLTLLVVAIILFILLQKWINKKLGNPVKN